MHYRPDRVGDLSYRGVAANVLHTNLAGGVQFDLSRPLGAAHTLRAGLFAERERGSVANASTVVGVSVSVGVGVGAPQFAPRRAVYLALSKPFRF